MKLSRNSNVKHNQITLTMNENPINASLTSYKMESEPDVSLYVLMFVNKSISQHEQCFLRSISFFILIYFKLNEPEKQDIKLSVLKVYVD